MIRALAYPGMAVLLLACTPERETAEPEAAPTGEQVEAAPDPAACIPENHSRESLAALKAGGFQIADETERAAFALAITRCLASPDPALRDGVAFEALATLMRDRQLSVETMQTLRADLEVRLESVDPAGFEAPFAALVLAEVVRADRIQPFMTDEDLDRIARLANRYVAGIADYRGFDSSEGWRHGVAHGADLLMQLAMNPRVPRRGLELIRDAVAAQIGPVSHSYIHGEAERLARPILLMSRRGVFTEGEWTSWFKSVAGPGPLRTWDNAFASEEGLARRHNLTAFLSALYLNAALDEDDTDDVILPGVESALRTLP
jgi:hypothetical protein